MRVAVLTVSDRSAAGERADASGPAILERLAALGWEAAASQVVPDDQAQIEHWLCKWADQEEIDLVLTTGGTGFSPRDRTPEATKAACDRLAPGLAEAMRSAGLAKTPHAMLSRGVCGIRGSTLIVNLPGSPRAVREGLDVIVPVLPHAIQVLRGESGAEAGHSPSGRRHI